MSRSAATRSRRWRRSTDAAEVLAMQQAVREIYVDPAISDYIVRLVGATTDAPGRLPRCLAPRLPGALPRQPGVRGACPVATSSSRTTSRPWPSLRSRTGSCSRRLRPSAASTGAASSASCSRACPSDLRVPSRRPRASGRRSEALAAGSRCCASSASSPPSASSSPRRWSAGRPGSTSWLYLVGDRLRAGLPPGAARPRPTSRPAPGSTVGTPPSATP